MTSKVKFFHEPEDSTRSNPVKESVLTDTNNSTDQDNCSGRLIVSTKIMSYLQESEHIQRPEPELIQPEFAPSAYNHSTQTAKSQLVTYTHACMHARTHAHTHTHTRSLEGAELWFVFQHFNTLLVSSSLSLLVLKQFKRASTQISLHQ